eukprot:gene2972-3239_t
MGFLLLSSVIPIFILYSTWLILVDCVQDYSWHGDGSWETIYLEVFKDHPLRKGIDMKWLNFLRNKRISFVGDSITRYQYLALAWFLSSGQWSEDSGLPSMTCEKQWGHWGRFFHSTNMRLGCHEILDAYRPEGPFYPDIRENRYFHHFGLNLTISMNLYLPGRTIHLGRDIPTSEEFFSRCLGTSHTNTTISAQAKYSYATVQKFISDKITPFQPDYFIFNHGFWKPQMVHEPTYLPLLQQILANTTKHAVWKATTTGCRNPKQYEDDNLRKRLSEMGFLFFDAFALTKHIAFAEGGFIDNFHFAHFSVYREINLAFLQFLKEIESGTST